MFHFLRLFFRSQPNPERYRVTLTGVSHAVFDPDTGEPVEKDDMFAHAVLCWTREQERSDGDFFIEYDRRRGEVVSEERIKNWPLHT